MLIKYHSRPLLVFSVFANVLMLVAPLHMMQVYDRVLTSGSKDTLLYITLMAAIALVLFGISEAIRMRLAQRHSAAYTVENAEEIFNSVSGEASDSAGKANGFLRDFNTVKMFLASKSYINLYDLPFAPAFLLLLFIVHWQIGMLTLVGLGALVFIALANKKIGQESQQKAIETNNNAINFATAVIGRSEEVKAMGLLPNLLQRWGHLTAANLIAQEEASRTAAAFHGASRTVRQILQILIMAWGAWLVLNNDMSGGLIFAASMISSRALQPIEQIIGGWESLNRAKISLANLEEFLGSSKDKVEQMKQPTPNGALVASDVSLVVGGNTILESISFSLEPGSLLSITGPSGGGKSSLVRLLAGARSPSGGIIALDGCELRNWPEAQVGRYVGYLAQDAMLFPGTIAENIARMALQPDEQRVVSAAKMAGVHELINKMPDGYQTRVHSGEFRLSGGQLQRIALARALFSSPRLLLLDEPNAHLDPPSEASLFKVLKDLKSKGVTIVLVTQHGAIRDLATHNLRIENGRGVFNAVSARPAQQYYATGITRSTSTEARSVADRQLVVNSS